LQHEDFKLFQNMYEEQNVLQDSLSNGMLRPCIKGHVATI